MTQPTPPPGSHDRQFARDVAKQLDRRRTRRRLTLWTALLALVIAAASYLRFGGGLGVLGLGGGAGDGEGESRPRASPQRCAIRISASDITVNGRPMSHDAAIAACKIAPGVDLFPTGDVRHGDLEELKAALQTAGARDVVLHPLPRRSPDAPPGTPGAPAGPR